jgi:hypothetical protein
MNASLAKSIPADWFHPGLTLIWIKHLPQRSVCSWHGAGLPAPIIALHNP